IEGFPVGERSRVSTIEQFEPFQHNPLVRGVDKKLIVPVFVLINTIRVRCVDDGSPSNSPECQLEVVCDVCRFEGNINAPPKASSEGDVRCRDHCQSVRSVSSQFCGRSFSKPSSLTRSRMRCSTLSSNSKANPRSSCQSQYRGLIGQKLSLAAPADA